MSSDIPILYAVGGIPGIGKSTFLRQMLEKGMIPADAYYSCYDRAMLSIQAYREQAADAESRRRAFKEVEMPAREIETRQLNAVLEAKQNIIYDRTCALEDCFDVFAKAQALGYKIILHGFFVRPSLAIERCVKREEENGERHTPVAVAHERHQGFAKNFPFFVQGNDKIEPLDEVYLWHVTRHGKKFLAAEFKKGGEEAIHKYHQVLWFLRQSEGLIER